MLDARSRDEARPLVRGFGDDRRAIAGHSPSRQNVGPIEPDEIDGTPERPLEGGLQRQLRLKRHRRVDRQDGDVDVAVVAHRATRRRPEEDCEPHGVALQRRADGCDDGVPVHGAIVAPMAGAIERKLVPPARVRNHQRPGSATLGPMPVCVPPAPTPMPTPIDALGADVARAFTGTNLLYYGGAVAETGAMAFLGGDHAVRVAVQENLASGAYGEAAYFTGYLAPAIVAPGVWIVSMALHDRDMAGAGSAAVQALGVTLMTTAFLKIATGRVYPLNGGDPNAPDRLDHPEYAREFHPFGTLLALPAWPSGHTASFTSVVAALTGYWPDRLWIPLVGYPVALAIGFGMVDGDRHWTSDVVAGALVGHAIGYSIGRSFRLRAHGDAASGISLVPIVGPGLEGVGVGGTW